MYRISMETKNNNSKDLMIMHDKTSIINNNIVLRAIFTSIRYQTLRYLLLAHCICQFLMILNLKKSSIKTWLNMVIALLSSSIKMATLKLDY